MNKRDLLEAWRKAVREPEELGYIERVWRFIEALPDDNPKECEHEWYDKLHDGHYYCKKCNKYNGDKLMPEWEGKIDEWLKPRNLWEITFIPEKWEKILTYNGKPLKALIKALFREEMKNIGKEIIETCMLNPKMRVTDLVKKSMNKRGI